MILLNKYVSHDFDRYLGRVPKTPHYRISYNPLDSHHTKPNFGITRYAIVLVAANDANSCFCPIFRILNRAANYVEPFKMISIFHGPA